MRIPIILAYAAAALAVPSSSQLAVFETYRAPLSFTKLPEGPSLNSTINLRIALKQPRRGDLEDALRAVSDPKHRRYKRYLSDGEVHALGQPHDRSVAAVRQWLEAHGLDGNWTRRNDWVTVAGLTLAKAQEMLGAEYAVFRHDDGEELIRTESYSLPSHLHPHVDFIMPTNSFGRIRPQVRRMAKLTTISKDHEWFIGSFLRGLFGRDKCTDPYGVSSPCLRQLTGTEGYVPYSAASNSLGITGFLGEYPQDDDFNMFMEASRSDLASYMFAVQGIDGGADPQGLNSSQLNSSTGVEANLDIQTASGFVAPTQTIFYSTPGNAEFIADASTPEDTNEPFDVWLQWILAQPRSKIPNVISTSYGDDEQTVPPSYAQRVCYHLAELGARGVSVLFSSGDNGVGQDGQCFKNDGSNERTFLPTFPASCPWVTTVGATENFSPQQAVSRDGPGGFNSGGGFSNYFSRPDYQTGDVTSYLESVGSMNEGLYNPCGRATPDVSAQGARYLITYAHQWVTVGGTSAATPTFASVITLLNDYLISQGEGTLGFLNPWLYSKGRLGLIDVSVGTSQGCDTDGFPAAPGWDPVTGLGTPDFIGLQAMV